VDQLQLYGPDAAKHVPALQGGKRGVSGPTRFAQRYWSPTARLVAGLAGIGLTSWSLRRGAGLLSLGAGALGGGLFLRAITNLEVKRLLGIGAGRRAIDLDKSLYIDARREEVFSFFESLENFPRFMSHLKEVRPIGGGRWHWTVAGPADMPFEWDAEVTRFVPNEVLAWKSLGGATVGNAGIIRFMQEGEGTRIQIRMTYNPSAGAVGHAFAKLLGADPKKMMDDDLLRLKSLLEKAKASGRAGQVEAEDLRPIH
ncbi:MAG: SRPBCC family protein, partial [Deltaproteobacteria bacterium]|nr:SRPBCC family protein [Deltaproteobacteria bacterium]